MATQAAKVGDFDAAVEILRARVTGVTGVTGVTADVRKTDMSRNPVIFQIFQK